MSGRAPPVDPSSPTTLQAVAAIESVHTALRRGEPAGELARAVAARLREYGWVLYDWEARRLAWEVALVEREHAGLASAYAALRELAEASRSPRFAAEMVLFTLGTAAELPSPPALEAAAAQASSALVNGRRARALLGARVRLDPLDRAVVAALEERWKGTRTTTLRREPDAARDERSGWTIDLVERAVWLPDGARVDLAKRPLALRALTALFTHSGSATKSELAREAWSIADYHPLRDDKRMQVAVRDLRLLLEENPSAPVRLVTVADGYALGEREPVRMRAPPRGPEEAP